MAAGLDEIVIGPFNNGANHAATEDELRACLAWALENEWGSGLRQLFGHTAPIYRSQETMLTTGQEAILQEYGLEAVILYYAGVPFNTFSSFIPALSLEQRYNPLWYRSREDQDPLVLLPCIAAGDLIEQVSLENLMLDLHRRQLGGEIQSDLLIHLNEDADLETWLPAGLPKALAWFPNTGGLDEFIRRSTSIPGRSSACHRITSPLTRRAAKCSSGRIWPTAASTATIPGRRNTPACSSGRGWNNRAWLPTGRRHCPAAPGGRIDPALWQGMESAIFQAPDRAEHHPFWHVHADH